MSDDEVGTSETQAEVEAERDRYRQALLDIADHSGMAPSAELAAAMARRARTALEGGAT